MFSRRFFLKSGGLALVNVGLAPEALVRAGRAVSRRKVLVAIFQRGGVDGLNMIVPFGEPSYYADRPSIAIGAPGSGRGASIDLDGFFGMHPRLAPLEPLYRARLLAIVHACGSHDATRSHLDAQEYMETATPGVKRTSEGWLNRYLRARRHASAAPFRAVALGPLLPRALQGPATALAIGRIDRLGTLEHGTARGVAASRIEAGYSVGAEDGRHAAGRGLDPVWMWKSADPVTPAPGNSVEYPRSPYGHALRRIAQLIRADVGLEIACVDSGNWDHHANEGAAVGQLADRLDDFARGIAALARDLGDRIADVMILTMSEFGRAVAENGNGGTDHGHGNAMLIVGGRVNGGRVYGEWPGLARDRRYEGRDLAITTDFRTVFSDVVRGHLGLADPRPVFPGFTGPLAPSFSLILPA